LTDIHHQAILIQPDILTYLFFQWLKFQSSAGNATFKQIIGNNASDYNAVLQVAQSDIGYYAGSTDWKTVIGDWFIANLFNDPSNIHGYKGNITTVPPQTTSADFILYPGDGVYRKISSTVNITSSSSIGYIGLNNTGDTIDTDGSDGYTGNILLCFNYDGNPYSTPASVTLPSITVPASHTESSILSTDKASGVQTNNGSYPVDRIIGSKDGFKIKQ
jgi:hypothetical protein